MSKIKFSTDSDFDWQKFHQDLDTALADWLIDNTNAGIHEPVIDFADYVNRRRLQQNVPQPLSVTYPHQPEEDKER